MVRPQGRVAKGAVEHRSITQIYDPEGLFIPKLDRHLPDAHARRYRRAVDDFRAAFDAIWLAEGDTVRPDRL
jgi:hypothetical protein